jgi:hypothetical protein
VADIKKKLTVVCREEEEHVAWGEKETMRLLAEKPWLKKPFYGLLELQLTVAPMIAQAFADRAQGHTVLAQVPGFVAHVRARMWKQAQRLGFAPAERPGFAARLWAMAWGVALFVRSQFARSTSKLEHVYLKELGFAP